jgi:hypothetical protein
MGETMHTIEVRPSYRLVEFCKAFGVGRCLAYLEIAAGRLKVFKVGKLTMVAGEDALSWRDLHRRGPQPPRTA